MTPQASLWSWGNSLLVDLCIWFCILNLSLLFRAWCVQGRYAPDPGVGVQGHTPTARRNLKASRTFHGLAWHLPPPTPRMGRTTALGNLRGWCPLNCRAIPYPGRLQLEPGPGGSPAPQSHREWVLLSLPASLGQQTTGDAVRIMAPHSLKTSAQSLSFFELNIYLQFFLLV